MRTRVILPLAIVAAVAVAALAVSSRMPASQVGATDAVTTDASVAERLPAPRSAAVMVAEDPLQSLLTEQTRVLEERKRYLDALETAYRREPIDATWSNTAERALVDVMQSAPLLDTGITPDALATECRSRSCRITAAFADYDDAQDWANYFLTGTGGTLAQAELSIQRGADSATHVLIFGARR